MPNPVNPSPSRSEFTLLTPKRPAAGVATHTTALKGNLDLQSVRRSGCLWQGTFTSEITLTDPTEYSIIAHGRFHTSDGTKYDIAYGILGKKVVEPEKEMALDNTALTILVVGLVTAWMVFTAPPAYLLSTMGTVEATDCMIELMSESTLDAFELASAVLVAMGFTTDLTTTQTVIIVFVVIVVVNILVQDCYTFLYILNEWGRLYDLEHKRRTWSVAANAIIIPLAVLEVANYTAGEDQNVTDLTCIIVLSLDIGFRLKSDINHLRNHCSGKNVQEALRNSKAKYGGNNTFIIVDVMKQDAADATASAPAENELVMDVAVPVDDDTQKRACC